MEKRKCKISIRGCAGNAGKGSKQYSIGLPSKWIQAMSITPEDRDAVISFDGKVITIGKAKASAKEGESCPDVERDRSLTP